MKAAISALARAPAFSGLEAAEKELAAQLSEAEVAIFEGQPLSVQLEATNVGLAGFQKDLDKALGAVASREQQLADAKSKAAALQQAIELLLLLLATVTFAVVESPCCAKQFR